MNKKRLSGMAFLLLAAVFAFASAASADEGGHVDHAQSEAVGTEEALLQMASGGSYYLDADIVLSDTVEVDGEITLCLNGKLLQYENEAGSVFRIGKEGSLTVCDCSEEAHLYSVGADGLWSLADGADGKELRGGAILGGKGEKSKIGESESERFCGGFAYVDGGSLLLYGGNIVGNRADYGGAVYLTDEGYFEMNGGRICGNLSSVRGGGVFSYSGKFVLQGGSVLQNRSVKNGGGISVENGCIFNMYGGFVTGNTAGAWGGGIENFSDIKIRGGTVAENSAGEDGGGIYNAGIINMSGGSIRENSAKYGGGVCNDNALFIKDGTITSNLAQESGGGIYNGAKLQLDGGTIASNTATVSGGGIENDGECVMFGGMIGGSTADDANMADLGGGVCVYSGSFTMYGGSIERNTAVDGGGVENEALFLMNGGTVAYNFAAQQGGGITNRGELILTGDTEIVNNASGTDENAYAGGGIYWIAEKESYLGVSGAVNVTGNTTDGKDANLVVCGKGQISVTGEREGMQIGVTLLDGNKKAVSGTVAQTENGAFFFSDSEDFSLRVKDGEMSLAKKSAGAVIVIALIASAAGVAVIVLVAVKTQRKPRGFKK